MAAQRLDKLLSTLGLGSRSELRQMIKDGRVTVDGVVVRSPEARYDGESSILALDGRELRFRRYRYYMMDKPAGILCVTEDRKQRTVLELLPPELRRMGLFPVGRLDKDTSGLLLLTNDGDFAHRVISPRSGVEKRYLAEVEGEIDEEDVRSFREGLLLRDGTRCLPAGLEPHGDHQCIVTVMEGKYHQVKRMLASRGKPVLRLRRLSVGELSLGDELGPGGFRELSGEDLCKVLRDYHSAKSQKTP